MYRVGLVESIGGIRCFMRMLVLGMVERIRFFVRDIRIV